MVDWISGFVEARGSGSSKLYDTGAILRVHPGGEAEQIAAGSVLVDGSHDSRLLVKSPAHNTLYLSGNVVKHLQGHNLFGSTDHVGLFFSGGMAVRQAVGLFPSPGTWSSLLFDGPRLTRLDLTRSYRFASEHDAREWLRDVAGTARSRHGAALMRGDTVYLGKESERWTFKVYHKGDEVRSKKKGHKLAASLTSSQRAQLEGWAQGVLRFELCLRAKELVKLGTEFNPLTVWQSYHDKVTWNRNAEVSMSDMIEETLAPRLRGVLALWRQGADLRSVYPKPTFYRHRRELLDAVGVDIASPPPKGDTLASTPTVSGGLDAKGWDPEPIESLVYHPDPQLTLAYRSGEK